MRHIMPLTLVSCKYHAILWYILPEIKLSSRHSNLIFDIIYFCVQITQRLQGNRRTPNTEHANGAFKSISPGVRDTGRPPEYLVYSSCKFIWLFGRYLWTTPDPSTNRPGQRSPAWVGVFSIMASAMGLNPSRK